MAQALRVRLQKSLKSNTTRVFLDELRVASSFKMGLFGVSKKRFVR